MIIQGPYLSNFRSWFMHLPTLRKEMKHFERKKKSVDAGLNEAHVIATVQDHEDLTSIKIQESSPSASRHVDISWEALHAEDLKLRVDKEKMEAARAEADKIIDDPLYGLSKREPTPQSGVVAPEVQATQEPLASDTGSC